MAIDERLAERVRAAMADVDNVREQRMFGGLAFLVNGKMCVSVSGRGGLMCRIRAEQHALAVQREGWGPVIMQGRTMRGYVRITASAVAKPKDLNACIRQALEALP